ncbi:MAG: YolD-like family protein [Clostridia bacterium]|nr:YolD-like family protein [Clostridia bacterium]
MKEPAADRAKQFAPFAALSGFEGYIEEREHIAVPRPSLAEDEIERINARLCSISVGERVRVRVYSADGFVTVEGALRSIDPAFGIIKIDKRCINLADVVEVESVIQKESG